VPPCRRKNDRKYCINYVDCVHSVGDMVELRKRPPPKETATPPPKAKRGNSGPIKKLADKAKGAVAGGKKTEPEPEPSTAPVAANGNGHRPIEVGQKIDLDGFGGTVQTHDGKDVTLKELVDESLAGVVIFTYPRASTPGCTTQACLFRDNYAPITGASLAVYGLSTDSPKANTTFVTKQKLPYPLLVISGTPFQRPVTDTQCSATRRPPSHRPLA